MKTFPWWKAGSHGGRLRQEWLQDKPLTLLEGGTAEVITAARFLAHKEAFHQGGTLQGLVCLTQLEMVLSMKSFRFQVEQLEKLGRKLFTNGNPDDMDPVGLATDSYFDTYDFAFPFAWSEKLAIPVVVRDTGCFPPKKYIMAMDEVILAILKMVDKCERLMREAAAKGDAKEKKYAEAIKSARRLQRNVPFVFHYCASDQEVQETCANLREEVETLYEYCGITGWNKIALIGHTRDELAKSGPPPSVEAILKALAKIRWGRDRALTEAIVTKSLTVFTKMRDCPGAVEWVQRAHAYWGRGSPWEEWTKLNALLAQCKSNSEILWCMQTIVSEKLTGKRTENYSVNELTKKGSAIQLMLLRMKFVQGFEEVYLKPASELARSNSNEDLAKATYALAAGVVVSFHAPPHCFPPAPTSESSCVLGLKALSTLGRRLWTGSPRSTTTWRAFTGWGSRRMFTSSRGIP